eukprot:scaffold9450_cov88-Phaeocystis_antarctica.AAC.4
MIACVSATGRQQTDLEAALQLLELLFVCDHLGARLVHRHVGERLDGREAVPPLLQLGGRSDRRGFPSAISVWVALDELLDGTAKVGAGLKDLERDLAEAEAVVRVVCSHARTLSCSRARPLLAGRWSLRA